MRYYISGMVVMKKVLLGVCFFVLLSITIYLNIMLNGIKDNNNNLRNEISKINNDIKEIEKNNKKYEDEISELRESSKDKLEEQEIWIKAKEKLNQAL